MWYWSLQLHFYQERVIVQLQRGSRSWLRRQFRAVLDSLCTFLALGALLLDTHVGFCVLLLSSGHTLNTPGMTCSKSLLDLSRSQQLSSHSRCPPGSTLAWPPSQLRQLLLPLPSLQWDLHLSLDEVTNRLPPVQWLTKHLLTLESVSLILSGSPCMAWSSLDTPP